LEDAGFALEKFLMIGACDGRQAREMLSKGTLFSLSNQWEV
jgi:hypothetical protein